MKLITAIVRADKLDDATRALVNAGARGMTATEVRGFGQQYGHAREASPTERATLLLPKFRIDVVVQDQQATAVADAIAKSVRTGAIGDGKIWMCAADGALRVRTGERDEDAI
ncbi:MAG TPA: P-II family nitrogen regulator [Trebonia sp.]